MSFIERERSNFILKIKGDFPWRETVLRAHRMKSDEKSFFSQICACCNWQVFFSLFLTIFLNLRLSLIVPLINVLLPFLVFLGGAHSVISVYFCLSFYLRILQSVQYKVKQTSFILQLTLSNFDIQDVASCGKYTIATVYGAPNR